MRQLCNGCKTYKIIVNGGYGVNDACRHEGGDNMPPKPSDPHEIEQEQKDHENYEVTEDILNEIEKDCPPVRHVKIWLCQSCLDGQGDECHTPGCALCFNRCPDMPIAPELYEIVEDMSDEETE